MVLIELPFKIFLDNISYIGSFYIARSELYVQLASSYQDILLEKYLMINDIIFNSVLLILPMPSCNLAEYDSFYTSPLI